MTASRNAVWGASGGVEHMGLGRSVKILAVECRNMRWQRFAPALGSAALGEWAIDARGANEHRPNRDGSSRAAPLGRLLPSLIEPDAGRYLQAQPGPNHRMTIPSSRSLTRWTRRPGLFILVPLTVLRW